MHGCSHYTEHGTEVTRMYRRHDVTLHVYMSKKWLLHTSVCVCQLLCSRFGHRGMKVGLDFFLKITEANVTCPGLGNVKHQHRTNFMYLFIYFIYIYLFISQT